MTYPPDDPYAQQPPANDPYGTPPPQSPYGQQPYGQPGYGYQPYGMVPAAPPTNTMAILSLVFAFVFSPLGIVFGHMAKSQIAQRGEGGDGLATAGLILSYIFTLPIILFCCLGVIGLASSGGNY
jgi:hypothetical protein